MKRLSVLVLTAVMFCLLTTDALNAKSREKAKALKAVAVKPKNVSQMSPEELKAAQCRIDKFEKDFQLRHEKLLKELYSIRAIAIKERAHETVEQIDKLIESEKSLLQRSALLPIETDKKAGR